MINRIYGAINLGDEDTPGTIKYIRGVLLKEDDMLVACIGNNSYIFRYNPNSTENEILGDDPNFIIPKGITSDLPGRWVSTSYRGMLGGVTGPIGPTGPMPTGMLVNPMTHSGDIIVGGVDGNPEALSVGMNETVLTVIGGIPYWGYPTRTITGVDYDNSRLRNIKLMTGTPSLEDFDGEGSIIGVYTP